MMLEVHFHASDVDPNKKHHQIDRPDGTTLDDLMNEFMVMDGFSHLGQELKGSTVLIGGKRINLDTVLSDGDVIRIIRTLGGG